MGGGSDGGYGVPRLSTTICRPLLLLPPPTWAKDWEGGAPTSAWLVICLLARRPVLCGRDGETELDTTTEGDRETRRTGERVMDKRPGSSVEFDWSSKLGMAGLGTLNCALVAFNTDGVRGPDPTLSTFLCTVLATPLEEEGPRKCPDFVN